MERPEITVENYKQVYDYYRTVEQPGRVLKLAYAALNGILRPRVDLADGAQADLDRIRDESIPHFYIFNHLSKLDYPIFASTLYQISREDIGHIRTMGADFNFRRPHFRPSFQFGMGSVSDYIGAIPVFRSVDYPDTDLRPVQEELFHCVRDTLAMGQKAAAAPEGTINRTDDPVKLLKFHSGVAEVIFRTTALLDREAGITPMGFCYKLDPEKRNKARKVSVHVGRSLFVPPGMPVSEITERARADLQHAAIVARELY